jgi:predicted lactoylglutathione lyase
MKLPMPVPEIPVTDVRAAADAYQRQMGFNVDWTYEDYLAGITKDDARLYLRRRTPEEDQARYAVLVWLNMASAAEVDELHARWTERGVRIVKELQTAPYGLREFTAEDLDGNRIRVFFVLGA